MPSTSRTTLGLSAIVVSTWTIVLWTAQADPLSPPRPAGAGPVPPARAEPVNFVRDIMPMLSRLGCNQAACHGGANGRGGLRLSMFGADPADDHAAITRDGRGLRINRVQPGESLLLLKVSGGLSHEGGARAKPDSPDYRTLLAWIAQGARYTGDRDWRGLSLKVAPASLTLATGQTARLKVAASFPDGGERDVAADATFKSSGPAVEVDPAGNVTARRFGSGFVLVSYLRRSAVVRVDVPQPLAGPFPNVRPFNRIDELVLARLRALGLPPSEVCTDGEFLRRVHLDLTGLLPSADEARRFLASESRTKRAELIDALLASDRFVDFAALKWGDLLRIKSEYPVRIWPKAVQVYYDWLRQSIAANKPYDQFVRELLTATGSNFRCGPANFMRAVPSKDPRTVAETAALVFMGMRIGCARCHAHPQESWSLDDDLSLAAFFAKVAYKPTLEWKEEIVYVNPKAALRDPRTRQVVRPRLPSLPAPPGGAPGAPLDIPPDEDPRARFADWLTAPDNAIFSANIVNRVWFWLLGRGIVNEPDDMRPTNPPSNPELLDHLARELVEHAFDLRHIYRLVLNSRTYQASSRAGELNKADADHFSHYHVRRLGAEQLLDALCQVTETSETFASRIPEPYTRMPPGCRAIQLADGNIESPILELLGRPGRDTPYEAERSAELSMQQVLYFINSDHLENKIAASPRLRRLVASTRPDGEIIDELYLSTLCRFPTPAEKQKLLEHVGKDKKARAAAFQDVLWALLNSKEFLFNH